MKALQRGFWLLLLVTLTLTSITASPVGYCHDKADGSVYPIAGTCTTYIYCLHENAIVLTCPNGEGFSQAAHGCLTKAKSDCAPQTTTMPFDGAINTTLGACLDNEQRTENKVACMGQPFGELMPYPGNCSRFLVCNCEYPTVKNCSAGLWFNNAAKVCDWPQNVNCSNAIRPPVECTPPAGMSASVCDQSKDGTLLRYPYNCNAYVNCTVGCPVLNYCATDKVYNELLKICDTPDTAICENEPIPTTTPSVSNEPTTTTENPSTPHVCGEPPFGIENYFCTHQPEGSFHNYPYNCTAYVECRGGCAKLDYCEPGKIFNNILDICDTPNSVVCHELPYPGSTTTTTESPVTDSPTTSPNLPPVINPTSCVNRPDHTLVPYPNNCAQYIECMNNGNIIHTCPDGAVFNPNLLICDQASHDSCYGGSSVGPTVTAATPSLPPVVFEKCLNSPKGTTYPYSTDCQLYYYCWGNNTSTVLACPNNHYYNPQTGNCGPDVSATACQESATTTIAPTINPETICENQVTGSTFPVHDNCAKYIMCVGAGSSVTLNCPNNNYYNPNTGNCGPEVSPTASQKIVNVSPKPSSSATQKSSSKVLSTTLTANICDNVPNFSIVPDAQNCSQFIVCMNKNPMFVECAAGEYFDPSIGNCDTTATSETCTNWHYTVAPNTPPTSPPTLQGVCGNRTQGELIAYPGNCTKYIVCVKPEPVAFSCPNNWYFNEPMQQCDSPEEAKCTETSVSTPPNGGTTTAAPLTDVCNGAINGTTFPYTQNCQMFIRCAGNNFYLYDVCNNQENYDAVTGECGANVACNDGSSTSNEPPEMTGVCAGQKPGSKIPYPDNCSKYIVCVLPIPIGYDCGENLEFNSELQECTTPENANCGSTGGIGGTTTITEGTVTTSAPKTCADLPNASTLPYPEDCSKYIVCLNGQPMLVQCNANSYYNTESGSCDQQTSATACQKSDQTTTSIHSTETTESTTLSAAPRTCADLPNDSTLPYPDDCSQYYVCLNGQPMLVQCNPNQYYNMQTGSCDGQTSATACKESETTITEGTTTPMLSTTETTITASTTDSTTEKITTTIQSTTPLETSTTEEFTTTSSTPKTCTGLANGVTFPYPTDCSKYITCVNGQDVLTNCMPKQYYNEQTGNCDSHTSETACRNSGTTTEITNSPETTTTKTYDTTIPETTSSPVTTEEHFTSTVTTTTQQIYEKCLDQPIGITFPYTEDCSLYYYCWGNNTSSLLPCPNNNYYNPQTGRCGPEVSSTACQDLISTTTSSTTTPIGTTHSGSTIETTTEIGITTDEQLSTIAATTEITATSKESTAHSETSTTVEFTSTTSEATHTPELTTSTQSESTQSANTTFTTTEITATSTESTTHSGTSTTVEFTTTTTAPKTCTDLSNGATLPYPKDCSKYIVCVNGQEMVTECMPNQYYNIQTGNCDSQTSETACSNNESTTSESTHTPELTTTTQSESTHSDNTTYSTTEHATTSNGSTEPESTHTQEPSTTTQSGTTLSNNTTFTTTGITAPSTESTTHSGTSTTVEFTTTTSAPKTCADLSNGATLPYPADCSKYIVCVNGQEMVTECMPNQYYNIQTGNCDSQTSETACRNNETTTSEATQTPELTSTQSESTHSDYTTNSTTEVVSTSNGSTEPESTHTPELTTTQSNATFTTTEITAPSTESTTHSETSTTVEFTTTTSAPKTCADLSNGATLPYPTDCSKYIVCVNGQEMVTECMPNQYYNIQTGNCDSQTSETDCRNSETTTPGSTSEPTTTQSESTQSENTTFSTTEFTTTSNESTSNSETPTTTTDEITTTTKEQDTSTTIQDITTLTPNTCIDLPNNSTLSYPSDCSKYIKCLDGQEVLVPCMPNTYYNILTGKCDDQTSETACRNSATTTTVTNIPESSTSERVETTPTSDISTTIDASTETTTLQPFYEKCFDQPIGTTFSYVEDCHLYYYCWGNNTSSLLPCPINNYYNPITGRCGPEVSSTACQELISTTSTDTTEITSENTTPTSTIAPINCVGKPNGDSLPYFNDCSKYIICLNGKETIAQCIPNTFYNIQTGNCDRQTTDMSCHDSTTTTAATETATPEMSTVLSTISEEFTSSSTNTKDSTVSTTPDSTTSTAAPNVCTGITNGNTLPYLDDCSEYIICWNDHEILTKCSPNTFYNTLTGDCDAHTSNTFCRDSITTTTTTQATDASTSSPEVTKQTENYASTTGKVTATVDLSSSTLAMTTNYPTTSTAGTTTTPNSCTGLESGTTLPYYSDCSLYIFCFKNKEIIALCLPDTYYDIYSGYCNKQTTKSGCRESTTTTISTETASVTSTSKTQETTVKEYSTLPTTTANKETTTFLETSTPKVTTNTLETTTDEASSSAAPPNSCSDVPNGTSLPYLSDCSKYIICWNKQVILTQCMPETYFNVQTGDCDAQISNTSCHDSTTTTISTQNTKVTTSSSKVTVSTDYPEITTTSADGSTTTTKPNSCTGLESGMTLPYLNDCSKYIFCLNNKEIVALCMPNTYFDIYSGNCNQITSNSACRDSKTTTMSTDITSTPQSTSTTKTDDTTLAETSTPGMTIFTTETTKSSTEDTSSSAAPNLCNGLPNGTSLPYRSDCSKYIICWNNQMILSKCVPQTYFNILTGDCDKETSNKSCRDSTTSTTPSQNSEGTTSSPEVTMYTNQPENLTTTTTADSTVSEKPNSCTGLESGTTLSYRNDCSLYVFCFKNREILAICPTNTYYDVYTGNCNQQTSDSACREETTTKIYSETSSTPTTISEQTRTSTISTIPTTTNDMSTINDTTTSDQFTSTSFGTTFTTETTNPTTDVSRTSTMLDETSTIPTTIGIMSTTKDTSTSDKFTSTSVGTTFTTETTNPTTDVTRTSAMLDETSTIPTTIVDMSTTRDTTKSGQFTTTSVGTTFTTETTQTTSDTTSTALPSSCTGVPNGTSLPYPHDCAKYIICWNNQVILTQCLPNTFYNIQTATCNRQTSNTACRDTTSTTTTSSTQTTITSTTTMEPTLTTASVDPCYDQPAGYQVPYPNNCSKYIICNDPLPVGHDCPDNLEFNASIQECVLPELANCNIKTSTTTIDATSTATDLKSTTLDPLISTTLDPLITTLDPTTTLDPPMTTSDTNLTTLTLNICFNRENGVRFPYGNNCTGFVYCENGAERYELCQSGYYYNPSVDACDNNASPEVCLDFEMTTTLPTTTTFNPTESTSTTLNPRTPNVCCGKPLNARVIYPDDCSKYITCAYPVPIVGQCPINTSFDTGSLQCISSNVAQCRTSTGQSAVKVTTTTPIAVRPTPTTTPSNIILQGECTYLPSGSQLVYIGDCTKYNFCFGGQSYVLSCSGNFYFNPYRKQCVPTNSYKCPW